MNKLVQPTLVALGATTLFSGAFVGFAHLRGAAAYELPLVGSLFEAPAELEAEAPADETPTPAPREPAPRQAGLGLLDVFRIDAPISAGELAELARSLKARLAQLDERVAELDDREERLEERALFLDEQFGSLAELRTSLERWQLELEGRQAEVERDESARAESEAESWTRLAKLFEKGDAPSLARKLEAWSPQEAAQVLRHLKPDRARDLLEGLSGESWKDYWEAYRIALGDQAP